MKKNILVLMLVLLVYPYSTSAKENITITCKNTTLFNNQETECVIKAENINYGITSISAKTSTTQNLEITESSYDDTKWFMLDKEFTVKDINLISETKENGQAITIAKFKIKANNKNNSTETIKITDIVIGDEVYEEHNEESSEIMLKLQYDEKYDAEKQQNKVIIITLISLVVIIVSYIYLKKRKK